ncbi:XdhC family protein [Oscillibacter sp.]|uniref:XdhC family protein n=1 Tax=Oscillibacter sp. TaxID=1945593 RepID=UPI00261C5090|nr:XdhC/CoxI family protein [Oscillibacter sp.]MDD3346585.1 XdhC family protein [Oscillibacter sp.]
MREFFKVLRAQLSQGEDTALATIVARSGSAPRGAGARMLVGAQGRLWGTVGGGRIEREAELLSRDALRQKRGVLREFCLGADQVESIGMVCGGDVTLAVTYLPGGDEGLCALADAALALLDAGGDGWLLSPLTGPQAGELSLLPAAKAAERFPALTSAAGESVLLEADGDSLFAQRLARRGEVYLFGGGHVARELAPLLARLDFPFTVVDDRPEFSVPADFPGARRVICTDFAKLLDAVSPTGADYAAVMTHGHLFDLEVQKQLLATPVGYIGVMGSRKKKAFVFEKLLEAGFSDADLARIVTPIGLALGGETPAEIALSIAAQLVALRAGRQNRHKRPI